jgi:hypothetical protein
MALAAHLWYFLAVLLAFWPATTSDQLADEKFPAELAKFVPFRKKPVFTGAQGQWDAMMRERGWIMKDNGIWKLWYTGYVDRKGPMMLGYATSKDGCHRSLQTQPLMCTSKPATTWLISGNSGRAG